LGYTVGYTVTVNNTTISGNSAGGVGASIWSDGTSVFNDNILENSIIANALSSSSHCFGTFIVSLGHNLADDASCGLTATGDLVVADAKLGPLADNGGPTETHALLTTSAAIDAASPGCPPPATDQRGVLRPQGAACDIGAFEVELAAPIPALTPFGRAAFVILLFAAMIGALRVRRREPRSE